MIVTPDVFVGRYAIAQPYKDGTLKLEQYILYYERKYLQLLFGLNLYLEFIEDSEDEKFAPLFGLGLAEALRDVIYGHVKHEETKLQPSTGNIVPETEGGKIHTGDTIIFNEGIAVFKTIREYLIENKETFPNYKGDEFTLSYTW
jgi:hypothetical protein